jgi:hypothetical protein
MNLPFLESDMQPYATRVRVYVNTPKSSAAETVYSVVDVKTRRVIFHTNEVRLEDTTMRRDANGKSMLLGRLRGPLTKPEYTRWSMIDLDVENLTDAFGNAVSEAAFVSLRPEGVFFSTPRKNTINQ